MQPGVRRILALRQALQEAAREVTTQPLRKRKVQTVVPSRKMAMPLVRLSSADVWIDARRVLRDIDLEVRRGQCWVVHGANGSGKSTLLRTIYGDHPVADGGRIERAGIEPGVPLDDFRARTGFVAPGAPYVCTAAIRSPP